MEITTTTINRKSGRRAAVNALALVGFIALLIIGVGLAIYSARFIPNIASRFGGAAVSLSSIFNRNETPALEVVTATTTLPIEAPVTVATTTATTTAVTTTPPVKRPNPGQSTTVTSVVSTPVAPYGNADLTVLSARTGYLTTPGNTATFVASSNVPFGSSGAIQFTVTNTGTNYTGSWAFNVDVPTSPAQNFSSGNQSSLAPGDSIDYVLGFDRGNGGANRLITITLDPNNQVIEKNEGNNVASRGIDINN